MLIATFFAIATTGFLLGSAFSWIIWKFFIKNLRPSLELSPYIAQRRSGKESVYLFRILNCSRFACYEVRIRLFLVKSIQIGNLSQVDRSIYEDIPLGCGDVIWIPGAKNSGPTGAVNIKCFEDLLEMFSSKDSEQNFFRLEVSGCHAISGIRGMFSKDYRHLDQCIKIGDFRHGRDLNVAE